MTREQLIRELEFYRDLGLDTIYVSPASAAPATPSTSESHSQTHTVPGKPRPANDLKPQAEHQADVPLPSSASGPAASSPVVLRSLSLNAVPTMYDALGVDPKGDSLAKILEDIGDCRRCRLCNDRNKIVFGSGNEHAKLVFVGEAPGEEEDKTGLPIVGRAGQLLTKMIDGTAEREGIPIRRKDVYICNVAKCRPPNNRKPEPDEMEICGQFLYRQLEVIKPKAICVMGATAAQALLNTKERMGKLRGEWFRWRDIPVMVTYHPSYLLRAYNVEAKREAWEDLKKVLHFVYDDPANLP
ncbi:MAG: uracil-DNA glycosylase [Bryobacterales bacterium]|nr:uracil-DNA glycosylase [Bryobacterales bacterium]